MIFSSAPCSFFLSGYTLLLQNCKYFNHLSQTLFYVPNNSGPIGFGKVCQNWSLSSLSFLFLTYCYSNAGKQLSLKSLPGMMEREGRQATFPSSFWALRKQNKICDGQFDFCFSNLSEKHHHLGSLGPLKITVLGILRPWILETTLLIERRTDSTIHWMLQWVSLWKSLTCPLSRHLRHRYPICVVDMAKVIQC